MPNYLLTLAYDGTHYLGWQKAQEGETIESSLEKALTQILSHPVKLQAASRTDRGVHAEEQKVNFITDKVLPLSKIQYSLNSLLPSDIRITKVQEVPDDFHPTLAAKEKTYVYTITNHTYQLPFDRQTAWHYPLPLNLEAMEKASTHFIGEKDFSALTNVSPSNPYDKTRHVSKIEIAKGPHSEIRIAVTGTSFLYKMVRNIVGTLVYVGAGKIPLSDVEKILTNRQRPEMGMTAPAHGLCLKKVKL